jgi:Flp pilus assembly protein TadG
MTDNHGTKVGSGRRLMNHKNNKQRNRRGRQGFVLVTMAVASIAIFGMLGLSVDMARMYVGKNEAQSYADAAALAGALKLDGTSAGVANAKTAAIGLSDKWNFMTSTYSGTTVEVATALAGPWISATTPPSPATNYTFLRITATAPVSLYFIPAVTGGAFTGTVNAQAVANQTLETTSNEGLFPFSPIAFDGPNGGSHSTAPWGFIPGSQYTMRYAANGKSECAGDDADSDHLKNGSARGFWGDNAVPTIDGQITGDIQEESLTIGQVLPGVGGAKTAVDTAIVSRIDQDGDTTDDTYASYLANPSHNGRRVIYMPIQSEVDGTVLGFGTFLLLDDGQYDHTGNSNWCAIFIGPGVPDSAGAGANSTAGVYQIKLVQ